MPTTSDPRAATAQGTRHRGWLRAAKLVVLVLVLAGASGTAVRAWRELTAQGVDLRDVRWEWLLAAAGFHLAGLLPSAWFWRRVLSSLGAPLRWGQVLPAYYVGHLGKYVPGKALVLVLRASWLSGHSVPATVAVVSVFYETLWMMATGASVAAVGLLVRLDDARAFLGLAVGLAVLAGAPLVPAVFARLVGKLGGRRVPPELLTRLTQWRHAELTRGWLGVALGWVILGLALWACANACGPAVDLAPCEVALYAAASALAVVAGFLSLIPGGLLVREAVLLPLLAPSLGAGRALVAVVLHRLITLVAEVLVSVILYLYVVRRRSRAQ